MRESKFRVWDKEENKFCYFTLQEILERRMSYKGSWDYKILKYEKSQYTGFIDKNGKGVYEGDIVKFEPYEYDYDNLLELLKKDKLYLIKYINASYVLINTETKELDAYLGDCAESTIEIVGDKFGGIDK